MDYKAIFKVQNIKRAFLFGVVYFILFNTSVVIFKFSYYKADVLRSILELFKDFLYLNLTLTVVFLGLSINRISFAIGSIFLFITGAVASYYLFFLKIPPSRNIMRLVFEAENADVAELLDMKILIWIGIVITILMYLLRRYKHRVPALFERILCLGCLVLTVANIVSPYRLLSSYFPIQYIHNTYEYLSQRYGIRPSKVDISEQYSFVDGSDEDLVFVFVIGESARYDHFGINGYHRDTTPYLSKMNSLFTFHAKSFYNVTHLSVPYMISMLGHQEGEKAIYQTTAVSVFSKLGFDTAWIATQVMMKSMQPYVKHTFYDEAKFHIVPGGSALYQALDCDGVIMPYFDNVLNNKHNNMLNNEQGKKFIVLHTCGSHWDYQARYPRIFEKFTPVCKWTFRNRDPSSCSVEEVVNMYDNSVLYTDYVLNDIIERLKDRNAILIYTSDHGEMLGENGEYGHGREVPRDQELSVPFFVWLSDKFIRQNPSKHEALQKNLNSVIDHDYIFHSLLDCADIKSDIVDANKSICRKIHE